MKLKDFMNENENFAICCNKLTIMVTKEDMNTEITTFEFFPLDDNPAETYDKINKYGDKTVFCLSALTCDRNDIKIYVC